MNYREIRCVQGSDEWLNERLGIMTASRFSALVTPTGRPSKQWEKMANMCVAERMLGGVDDGFQSDAMIRGQSLEYEALEFFNITSGFNFEKVGFFRATKDGIDLPYGCSPDGVDYGKCIGLELKCPLSHTHIEYILNNRLPKEYIHQVQGSLLVTGFDKWVFGSYHPDIKCFHVEVGRDEKYIKVLKEQIEMCAEEIEKRLSMVLVSELPE